MSRLSALKQNIATLIASHQDQQAIHTHCSFDTNSLLTTPPFQLTRSYPSHAHLFTDAHSIPHLFPISTPTIITRRRRLLRHIQVPRQRPKRNLRRVFLRLGHIVAIVPEARRIMDAVDSCHRGPGCATAYWSVGLVCLCSLEYGGEGREQ
jgi:hypothetical protein